MEDVLGLYYCEFLDPSTHSLKPVCLSWVAKYELELDDRSILGIVLLRAGPPLWYCMDNQAAPLHKLKEFLS